MSSKRIRNLYSRRSNHANINNRNRQAKIAVRPSPNQIKSDLIGHFQTWCTSLRATATFEFDNVEAPNHRCKMIFPLFPNLQSIGNGASTKKEAKANAIIAFLAHMEKRKQVGLFVPYMFPNLLRNVQAEIRQANVATPDLTANMNEYLLADRIVPPRIVKQYDKIIKIIQRICDVHIVRFWQSGSITFVYIVGAKSKEQFIRPYVKALFEPDTEQMFNYGEKLFDIFNDEKFLDGVCQRLKVLCDNKLEQCKLFIRGSSVNVQYCYNEFVILRREFENELRRGQKNSSSKPSTSTNPFESTTFNKQFESTRLDQDEQIPAEEKEDDQLPDYSVYDDDVNASMLRVLKDEEDGDEQRLNQEATTNNEPILIEVSDDSLDSQDLQIVQTIEPKTQKKPDQPQTTAPPQNTFQIVTPRLQPMPDYISLSQPTKQPLVQLSMKPPVHPIVQPPVQPSIQLPLQPAQRQPIILRHVVLDGQNVGRNSNDYNRSFCWCRLSNAINYFKNRGHENIIAFLPLYYREFSNKQLSANDANRERQTRDNLINSRYIAFTPSRYNNGKRLTNYDDRFILQYAADNDGVVVSNDNFRDLQHERSFQFIINNRILPFATINDTFMPATDPLGRNGPNLDEFLSKPYKDMSDIINWEIADRLRQRAREDLFSLLKSIVGQKDLFIDADLFPLIDLTSNATEIKAYGVGNLHKLDSAINVQTKNKRLFLLRPNMARFLALAKQLRQLDIRNAHLICVPRKFYAFEHLLEQEGLWGRCTLHELTAFDMVPVDYDIFSMVNSHLFLNVYLDQSTDWLSTLAASLIDFQRLFGKFSNTYSFGNLAGQVARQLERGLSSNDDQDWMSGMKQIQTVVLFDRSVDLITPFCSQMCYEGLVDEYFNIEAGRVKIPKTENADNSGKQFDHISLSTRDDMMIERIRAMHFTKVFQEIKAVLAQQNVLQNDFRDKMQDATISDLKQLVHTDVKGHINAKRQLTRHLDLCTDIYEKKKATDFKIQLEIEKDILHSQNFEDIVSYIHTMICRCEPSKYRPLQLLCLLSAANNGLTRESYELLCRSFLQAYGYDNIPLLYKLEKLNLFHVKRPCDVPISSSASTPAGFRGDAFLKMGKQVAQNLTDKTQTQKTFFQFMRKRLNLTPELNQQVKTTPGPDMADIFGSIYVPFSCRLIEEALLNPPKLSTLQHELIQRGYPGAEDLFSHRSSGVSTRAQYHDNQQSILVVFIGGCTQSEINALRMLALSKSNSKWRFYFAPTNVWTHTRLLQEIETAQ
ncbi:unnamed protein product [Rotaria socialis]|uniref:RNase NYN domain-containing protein n=2 Tax=Rotaria socialis TaxID=392032 RepID=A0A817XUG2_9BILA|nr:unnamed protein product [Rotaria socialis]